MDHIMNTHEMEYANHSHSMAMPAIFTTGTHLTLFFSGWKTSSLTSYLLTLLFLFVLALLNRFLGVLKYKFDDKTHSTLSDRRRRRIITNNINHVPRYLKNQGISHPQSEEWEELVSNRSAEPRGLIVRFLRSLFGIEPTEPWSWRRSGLRSLLEGARAFIGYML